jgi:hypothetical protein
MRRPVLAALLLLPLLAACGGGGGGGGGGEQRTEAAGSMGSAPRAAASAEPSPSPSTSAEKKPASKASSTQGPKNTVPDDELTPVTGSFTKQEKKYLSGRVPEGTDPAAILQAGQETCDKLASTAKVDRDATLGAVIAGEIKGAADAVKGLCPELKSLIEDTEGGYADGTHTDPAPGTYRALTPMEDCSWSLVGASGGEHRITVKKGTESFTSSGCYAWQKES